MIQTLLYLNSNETVLGTRTSSDGIEEWTANGTPILFIRSHLDIWNSLYNISLLKMWGFTQASVKAIALKLQFLPFKYNSVNSVSLSNLEINTEFLGDIATKFLKQATEFLRGETRKFWLRKLLLWRYVYLGIFSILFRRRRLFTLRGRWLKIYRVNIWRRNTALNKRTCWLFIGWTIYI